MTLGGHVVPIALEVAILLAFGLVLMPIALFNFRHQDWSARTRRLSARWPRRFWYPPQP